MRRSAVVSGWWSLALLASAARAHAEGPMNVQQAVEEALANHPSLKAATARVDQAEAAHSAVWETYYPQLSGYGGLQRNDVSGKTTTTTPGGVLGQPTTVTQSFQQSDTRFVAGANVDQFLFDFGGFTGQRRSTDATRRAQLSALETQRLEVTVNVKTTYYSLLRANRLLRYNQETVQRRQNRVQRIADLIARRTRDRKDLLQAQVDLANAQLNLARSQSEITDVEAAFLDALGERARSNRQLVDDVSLKPVNLTLEQAVERALTTRPELEQTKALLESQQAQVDAVGASYLPRVSAFLNAATLVPTGSSDLDHLNVFTGGLNLSLPTGWALGRQRMSQAQAALQEIRARQLELEQSITLGVNRSYTSLFESVERIKISQQLAQDALANWKETQARYRAGRATIVESTEAYNFLYEARVSLIQALYDAKIAEARLERAIGAPL